jgi:hypothetical protein
LLALALSLSGHARLLVGQVAADRDYLFSEN